ncbi:uncharacterized protein CCOS01_09489 [Colletotrichum costaricense]|uniref:Uncharacterized protein n=1 Tax=Colletotrichum costaricense TaxID=1209916 RepID=A0AAI9YUV4_9PEZI|nr:uncharacterized protein CCOS01_09489 [Colletotrichum costaricense]KAK1524402.1 hypothetical protein CCOS01_09489 [Colletotrichum costaricense]
MTPFTLETLYKASPALPEHTPVHRPIWHPSSPEEGDCPRTPQARHYEGAQLHQIQIRNPRDRETEKGKDKNVEATATALAAALTNAITGVVTHSMIDMEAAEQHGSITGQEILFSYFNHVGYNKIG